jgi:hypothetical protein
MFVTTMARLRPTLDRIGRAAFGSDWSIDQGAPEEERAIAAYHRHLAAVRESLPAERLLVFDVRQGWDPLCAFLGVEPPANEPFPHLNDSSMLQSLFERLNDHRTIHLSLRHRPIGPPNSRNTVAWCPARSLSVTASARPRRPSIRSHGPAGSSRRKFLKLPSSAAQMQAWHGTSGALLRGARGAEVLS